VSVLTPPYRPNLVPLRDALRTAFGVAGVLRLPLQEPKAGTIDYTLIPVLSQGPEPAAYSSRGNPVIEPGYLQAGTDVWGQPYDAYTFPYTTMLSFQRRKTMLITPMQGRAITTKEQINQGEWQVAIKGLLVSDDPNRPHPNAVHPPEPDKSYCGWCGAEIEGGHRC